MKNLLYLFVVIAFLVGGASAEAQRPPKIPKIGFMRGGSPTDPEVRHFGRGCASWGTSKGRTSSLNTRNTEGKTDRFPDAAAELVSLKVDIIVAAGGSAVVFAAKPATDTILLL